MLQASELRCEQEFLRGSSQNVCAARVLDAVDRLLDTLTTFRSGFCSAHRNHEYNAAEVQQCKYKQSSTMDGVSAQGTSAVAERHLASQSVSSQEEQSEAESTGVLLLKEAAAEVAQEFLQALRSWKGQIEPHKDLGHLGPSLPGSESLVSLGELGLTAGATPTVAPAHRAWPPPPLQQGDATAALDANVDDFFACGGGHAALQPDQFPDDDSETEEMDHGPSDPSLASKVSAAERPLRAGGAPGGPLVDMGGFFSSVKAQLAVMHAGLLRGDTAAICGAAREARELAEGSGSKSIAVRALAIECKADAGTGLRVADVDALEQQIEAADAIWRSCRITV